MVGFIGLLEFMAFGQKMGRQIEQDMVRRGASLRLSVDFTHEPTAKGRFLSLSAATSGGSVPSVCLNDTSPTLPDHRYEDRSRRIPAQREPLAGGSCGFAKYGDVRMGIWRLICFGEAGIPALKGSTAFLAPTSFNVSTSAFLSGLRETFLLVRPSVSLLLGPVRRPPPSRGAMLPITVANARGAGRNAVGPQAVPCGRIASGTV
jgi:hypothetical protein